MLITNHVLSGALVGRAAPGPASAFALGVASHFAIDTVPHWGDDRIFLQVAVPDGLVGLGAMAWVWRTTEPAARVRVLAGMAGACLPDADKPAPKRVRDDVWFMAFNRAAYVIGGAAITAALLDHGSVNYLLFVGAMVLMACFIRRKHIEG